MLHPPSTSPVARRRRWAYSLIQRAAEVPSYGSPEWLALPEGSSEKVVAAVCWASEGDDLADRLGRELDAERHAEAAVRGEQFRIEVVPMVRALRGGDARYTGQQLRPLEDIGAEYRRGSREAS